MLPIDDLKQILLKNKVISQGEIDALTSQAEAKKVPLERYLVFDKKIVSEKALYDMAAPHFNLPFTSLERKTIPRETVLMVPQIIAQTHSLVPFEKTEDTIKIATANPLDLQTFEFIKRTTNLEPEIYLAPPSEIERIIKQFHPTLAAEFKEIKEKPLEIIREKKGKEKSPAELAQDLPIIKVVDTLLKHAILEGASDIHIEPLEKEIVVRYRVDGVLKDVMTLPKNVLAGLVARVKVLSNLKLDEHRLPQDGRFKIVGDKGRIAFRVSVIPVFGGEKVVLRLLNESAQILNLEELGLSSISLTRVKNAIKKPHGMILVTGPTGCGKTTTLYTILNILNTPQVNIVTIEDPIEYQIPRVNQSQVNPRIGYTFAAGLRSFLRQDPDIIMVGEIRDKETADIAVNAAMTGHLVLSTLHTNDSVTALPRLTDMGIPNFLIAPTVNLIAAQRLVRKICAYCVVSYNLDKKNIDTLEKQVNLKEIIKLLAKEEIVEATDITPGKLLFYKGKGCKHCNNEGYHGRIGIYEVLEISPKISEMILRQASKKELYTQARAEGLITILEDGFIKAKQGITTIEEVLRVSKE